MLFLAAAVAAFTPLEARNLDAAPSYETRWFTQRADHFGAGAAAAATWKQRYLVNADRWGSQPPLANGCKGPILFYTGNEGPIDAFWSASGCDEQSIFLVGGLAGAPGPSRRPFQRLP